VKHKSSGTSVRLPLRLRATTRSKAVGVLAAMIVGALLWTPFVGDTSPRSSGAGAAGSTTSQASDSGGRQATPREALLEKSITERDGQVDSAAIERAIKKFERGQLRLANQSEQMRAALRQPLSFRVASFNVLGASHTGAGGHRNDYPAAATRMGLAISALRNNGVDVVGFQEFESPQYSMFTAQAGEYSTYPGLSLGNKSVRFNIAWRSSMWQLVEAHTLSIPYAGGSRIAMPVVLLESTTTGKRVWFANFHNPADTPRLGNNSRWRAEAASIEVAHLTQLFQEQGYPVIATGDYNERESIFCRFTAGGVFSAAAGGSSGGACAPPDRMEVDWVFGSTGIAFSNYAVTDTGRASDHSLVQATATLGPGVG
jgi:endonuclease/exonuclease/phosphatase family metal-dependent hydrolase